MAPITVQPTMAAIPRATFTFRATSAEPAGGPSGKVSEGSAGVGEGSGRVAEGLPRAPAAGGGSRGAGTVAGRSEEHTSELQSRENLACRLLLEKKNHNLQVPSSHSFSF